MAELKITEMQMPGKIEFNYEELKAELSAKVESYSTIVYTAENMAEAKKDRASLNRLSKALNDERLKREREFMEPFNTFKAQVAEIRSIIDRASLSIDKQIKEFEEQQKQAKKLDIAKIFEMGHEVGSIPRWLEMEQVENPKWLNATTSMSAIQDEIGEICEKIKKELDILAELPEYSFEATEVYKSSLDLGKAMAEGKRLADIQKRKEAEMKAREQREQEQKILAEKVNGTQKPSDVEIEAFSAQVEMTRRQSKKAKAQGVKRWWVNIRACVTLAEANDLKTYFAENGIEYTATTER